MLRDRYETDKFFLGIIKLTNEMDPILSRIDKLLDDEEIYQLIKADLSKRYPRTMQTGRSSTPVEVILRMLAIKRLYDLSFEETEYYVRDSLVLRHFCRVYLKNVPDDTTLIRWSILIKPKTLEKFNSRLTDLAVKSKITRGRKIRTDGTVVETNIHSPSDSTLLTDSTRVLGRTLKRAKEVLSDRADLTKELFRNRIRSARRLSRKIGREMSKRSESAREIGREAYRKLVNITKASLSQAQKVLRVLKERANEEAQALETTLEEFIPRVERVIEQSVRRIFHKENVPAGEKIVSIFEPHTDIIRRGKTDKSVEYGHKVWLNEVEGGIVSHYRILDGNPRDDTQWKRSLDRHIEGFGYPPEEASADRGVYSEENENYAREMEIKHIILPEAGHKSEDRRIYEKQRWFKRGRRWHAGIEGRISILKRRYGLKRCLYRGRSGFERWVGWGIIAGNLAVMGRKLAARSK